MKTQTQGNQRTTLTAVIADNRWNTVMAMATVNSMAGGILWCVRMRQWER